MEVENISKKAALMTVKTKRRMGGNVRDKYCYICKTVVPLSNSSMKEHQIREHSEEIVKIKKSNDTKDYVKSICKVCGVQEKVTSMRGHTKSAHGMTITEYKEKYDQVYFDLVELILHQCGICEEYLVLDSDYIAQHLKGGSSFHDITHGNYNAKFMTLQNNYQKQSSDANEKIPKKKPLKKSKRKEITQKDTFEKVIQSPKSASGTLTNISSIKLQTNFDAAVNALNDEIESTLKSFSKGSETESEEVEIITVESFRTLLDSLSIDGEEIRFPALESLLKLDI